VEYSNTAMKYSDQFYLDGMALTDKINFIGEKLGNIRNRLEEIADEMCKEDLRYDF
jgi:hypothetical protein